MLPGLRLNGIGNVNEQFMLECLIRDVLATRGWQTSNKLSVQEIKRGMLSLVHFLRMLQYDAAVLEVLSRKINSCMAKIEQVYSASSTKLSIGCVAQMLLMRHCQRLCDAVNEPDIEKAFDKMLQAQISDIDCEKHLVIKCRRDIYYGLFDSQCVTVLEALCAVSFLLRNLGPSHAVAADLCDAEVLQLLRHKQLFDKIDGLPVVSDALQTT